MTRTIRVAVGGLPRHVIVIVAAVIIVGNEPDPTLLQRPHQFARQIPLARSAGKNFIHQRDGEGEIILAVRQRKDAMLCSGVRNGICKRFYRKGFHRLLIRLLCAVQIHRHICPVKTQPHGSLHPCRIRPLIFHRKILSMFGDNGHNIACGACFCKHNLPGHFPFCA